MATESINCEEAAMGNVTAGRVEWAGVTAIRQALQCERRHPTSTSSTLAPSTLVPSTHVPSDSAERLTV